MLKLTTWHFRYNFQVKTINYYTHIITLLTTLKEVLFPLCPLLLVQILPHNLHWLTRNRQADQGRQSHSEWWSSQSPRKTRILSQKGWTIRNGANIECEKCSFRLSTHKISPPSEVLGGPLPINCGFPQVSMIWALRQRLFSVIVQRQPLLPLAVTQALETVGLTNRWSSIKSALLFSWFQNTFLGCDVIPISVLVNRLTKVPK